MGMTLSDSSYPVNTIAAIKYHLQHYPQFKLRDMCIPVSTKSMLICQLLDNFFLVTEAIAQL